MKNELERMRDFLNHCIAESRQKEADEKAKQEAFYESLHKVENLIKGN